MPYLVTIGLEVHAQVKTATKMFCSCQTSFAAEPNSHTCPVCLGMPGALPVLNRLAIEKTLLAGLMLGCSSPPISTWDRKNYFYPDMPKNYQTTQMELPLCLGGGVPLYTHCYPTDFRNQIAKPGKIVRLNRIHLEEDVAKSTHVGNSSLIDFNRAGTPLMEIVSEAEIDSAEEAFAYIRSLQMILQQGDVSDADMEKGQMRCDVNISIRKNLTDPLGPKVELKNLNSISAIRRAIHFEIERQSHDLDRGILQIQSTRRWDDDRGESQLMRTKEDAHDYRYFPCPDLLPIETEPLLEKIRPLVPELPHAMAERYERVFAVTTYDALVLSSDKHLATFFEATVDESLPGKKVANFIINTLLGSLNERTQSIADCPVRPAQIRALLNLTENGLLAASQAKEVFVVMLDHPERDPAAIADELGFKATSTDDLLVWVDQAITEHPSEVAAILAGNEKLLNFLTGKVMKSATPKPNPKQVTDLLRLRLQREITPQS
ncbi:MAG: Asp-tRNA(Asn)/Glu-tRNA(Gln) amidotransferase subunit GatB [Verrucomicrobia bacterium]|nr:MAG: Asp-tRNA(Asn)/Glu-tRNA(Gln) amidotransferase subunit GatB [Verrucomicrobiota bacterium]